MLGSIDNLVVSIVKSEMSTVHINNLQEQILQSIKTLTPEKQQKVLLKIVNMDSRHFRFDDTYNQIVYTT